MSTMKNFRIVNLFDYKQYIYCVANWLYNEFIKDQESDLNLNYMINQLNNRKKAEIPMTYIALLDDTCIGTASIFSNDLSKLPDLSPWLAALYVDKKHRNRGYGAKLLMKIEQKAKELGYSNIYLRTESANDYYKKKGWIKIKDIIDKNNILTSVYVKEVC